MEMIGMTKVIINTRNKYIKRHYENKDYITFREINISSSDLFAYNVICAMKRYRAKRSGYFQIQSTNTICDENNHIIPTRDILRLLSMSSINISCDQLINIPMNNYTWIYYEGKYYDIETPEGVDTFFDLPLINIHIKNYMNNNYIPQYIEAKRSPFIISEVQQDIEYPDKDFTRGYLYTLPTKEEYYGRKCGENSRIF